MKQSANEIRLARGQNSSRDWRPSAIYEQNLDPEHSVRKVYSLKAGMQSMTKAIRDSMTRITSTLVQVVKRRR